MKRVARRILSWSKHHRRWVFGGAMLLVVALVILFSFIFRGPSLDEQAAKHPNDKQVLIELAGKYIEDEEYTKARRMYQMVLDAEKSNTEAFLGMANSYVVEAERAETLKRQELRAEARKVLQELVALQPSEPRGYIALAELLPHEEGAALLRNALLYLPGEDSIIQALETHEKENGTSSSR